MPNYKPKCPEYGREKIGEGRCIITFLGEKMECNACTQIDMLERVFSDAESKNMEIDNEPFSRALENCGGIDEFALKVCLINNISATYTRKCDVCGKIKEETVYNGDSLQNVLSGPYECQLCRLERHTRTKRAQNKKLSAYRAIPLSSRNLTDYQKKVWDYYVRGYYAEEIGEILGKSRGAIYSCIREVKRKLETQVRD
jgi:DNA-binding CsgD family transcriptional regulator